jgi:cytochrome c oxidase subunit 2
MPIDRIIAYGMFIGTTCLFILYGHSPGDPKFPDFPDLPDNKSIESDDVKSQDKSSWVMVPDSAKALPIPKEIYKPKKRFFPVAVDELIRFSSFSSSAPTHLPYPSNLSLRSWAVWSSFYVCKTFWPSKTNTLHRLSDLYDKTVSENSSPRPPSDPTNSQYLSKISLPERVYDLPEPASPNLCSAIEFNQHLIVLIITVVLVVGWALWLVFNKYFNSIYVENRSFTHSQALETIWTTLPALTLLCLAVPSFTLLYSLEDNGAPEMTIKVIGHQWFWCYEMDDFLAFINCQIKGLRKSVRYTCYLLLIDEMPRYQLTGYLRLYETTKRVLMPVKVFLRFLITSVDVLHSWAVPNFGVKMDACPGRLNQINFTVEKNGIYFGSCYEICDIQHGFMPISLC